MSGSWTSSSTMSGRSERSILSPVVPSSASPTISNPSASRIARAEARKLGWSSTMRTVGGTRASWQKRRGEPQCGKPHSPDRRTQMQENRASQMRNSKDMEADGSTHCAEDAREIGPILRHTPAMSQTTDVSVHDRILAERARYVSAGVSTPSSSSPTPTARASPTSTGGASSTSPAASAARTRATASPPSSTPIKAQPDDYLHQCFMVGVYEPYVEVCRRLAELSPCAGEEQKSILVNSGAEAVENAVKIARCRHRPPGRRRLRQRLPRPHAADDDDDREGEAVQGGLRPVRARGLPGAGPESLPRCLDRRRDRRA